MLLNRKNLNDQVIEIILGKIRDGELKPGERLDSQDELAVKLGVSRSTVREAFSKLASMGVIDILHGQGTFVKKVQDYSYMDNLLASLNLLDKDSILHVLEVRKVIESSTVQLAAEKADGEDIEKLSEIINDMGKLLDDPKEYNRVDRDFHLEIARVGSNPVLLRLLYIILNSFHEELSSSVVAAESLDHSYETILQVMEGIREHDPEKAVSSMNKHIDFILNKTRSDLATD